MSRLIAYVFSLVVLTAVSLEGFEAWNPVGCSGSGLGFGPMGANGPSLDDSCYFDASLLYWKTGGDELDYGMVRYEYDNATGASYYDRYHDMKMDWDWGFKIGAGCPLPCYDWDVAAEWVHYVNNSQSHRNTTIDGSASNVTFAIPYISGSEIDFGLGETGVAHLSGHYRVRYDVVDIEFGKWMGKCAGLFNFRPHIGVRFANIHERLRSHLTTTSEFDPYFKSNVCNDFIGAGLRAGFDASLAIYQGISLIGRASGAIVWGRTKIDLEAKEIATATFSDPDKAHAKEGYFQGRAMADFALGVNWATELCSCPLDIELDWELRYLFGQHRFFTNNALAGFGSSYPTLQNKKNGDLTLQGVTLKLAMDF
jgi:hypothetical protein